MKVVIVDYGMGNIHSIRSVLKYIGIENILISNLKTDLEQADKLILPGVGAFGEAMHNIREKQLDSCLTDAVIDRKTPILGICLGMQLMSHSSTENGENQGLSFIDATVSKFNAGVKVPHVGFNQVSMENPSKLYHDLQSKADFYFTHSYRMQTNNNINAAWCEYGNESFIASYEIGNIAGVQFHPELSQINGIKLIKNFIDKF